MQNAAVAISIGIWLAARTLGPVSIYQPSDDCHYQQQQLVLQQQRQQEYMVAGTSAGHPGRCRVTVSTALAGDRD